MATLYENYITGDDGNYAILQTLQWAAQTFTPITNHIITSVKVKMLRSKAACVPGDITASILATDDNNVPTDNALASGVYPAEQANVITITSPGEWIEITLSAGYPLLAGTVYALALKSSTDSLTAPIHWRYDHEATYIGGDLYVSVNQGTSWSLAGAYNDAMFEEWGEPPIASSTVTTDSASSVVKTTATLNGTLDDDGGEACDCGFEYGETTDYGTLTGTESKETDETFSQDITGLLPNTTYHYRAIATNSAGTSYGSDRTFTTLIEPTATTDPATSLEKTAATLNGTLDDDGGEFCDCGFEYGETTAYGTTTPTEGKETGETFSQAISGLTPGKHYHFRAIATNSAGTSYGSDRSFFAKLSIKGNPNIDQLMFQHVERIDR